MCQDCGCSIEREVNINGQPGSSVSSPLITNSSEPKPHDSGHQHAHEHTDEHDHDHTHPDGTRHSHPHEHEHTHGDESSAPGEDSAGQTIEVNEAILSSNDRLAERNRGYFKAKGMVALNVLSSPGSGKTTLVQATIVRLATRLRTAVIVGDLATDNDARRLRETGAPVVQITTGTVCHLEADMVARSLGKMDLAGVHLLIIENVGNLVCPAAFDLGEDLRVAVLSVTEGEDKPLKYPPLFSSANVAVISKMDLAQATDFQRDEAVKNLRHVNPKIRIFEVSARTGQGMDAWCDFLCQLYQPVK
jgi:hydrogenase nickel incorporation protein HypB